MGRKCAPLLTQSLPKLIIILNEKDKINKPTFDLKIKVDSLPSNFGVKINEELDQICSLLIKEGKTRTIRKEVKPSNELLTCPLLTLPEAKNPLEEFIEVCCERDNRIFEVVETSSGPMKCRLIPGKQSRLQPRLASYNWEDDPETIFRVKFETFQNKYMKYCKEKYEGKN